MVEVLRDKEFLVKEYLETRGLYSHHINSFNAFIDSDLKKIIQQNHAVRSDADPNFYLHFKNVTVGHPQVDDGFNVTRNVTPQECRLRDLTYCAPIYVDIEYVKSGMKYLRKGFIIGRLPIMLRSNRCCLYQKSDAELAKMKECIYDSGGYFIVKGTEKVILMQEQPAKNKILVEKDSNGVPTVQVMSSTVDKKSKTNIIFKKNLIYVCHNALEENIPFVIFMKALGVCSDQLILQMVGTEFAIMNQMYPCFLEGSKLNIYTQKQALRFIGDRIKKMGFSSEDYDSRVITEVHDFLSTVILAHIPVTNTNYHMKAIYTSIMVRRLIFSLSNPDLFDSKDYYGNKCLDLPGSFLSLLFDDTFKRFTFELKSVADKNIPKVKATPFDIIKYIRTDTITNALVFAIQTGNWSIKRFRMERHGVTQVLTRLSYLSAIGMMTRVNSQFEKSRKVSGPRSLQPSQFGMLCPSDTPEGEACGLIKNISLLAHVTTESEDDDAVLQLALNLGVEPVGLYSVNDLHEDYMYLIIFNGNIIGSTNKCIDFVEKFRRCRRKGIFSKFISIYISERHKCIYINSGDGRLCRPYLVVENGQPLLTNAHIDDLKRGYCTFQDFIDQSLIEFIDVDEENNCLIAYNEEKIVSETTHMEMAPFSILGICASVIPFPHHNQSPRNTYQCAMGKQAIGTIALNYQHRIDTLQYNLWYTHIPMVHSKAVPMINYDKLPAGQNATIAVMSYSGYDIEDAIILNKASVDRGFGRGGTYRNSKCFLRHYPNQMMDSIQGPIIDNATKKPIYKHRALENDGIAAIGQPVFDKQVTINKATPKTITVEDVGGDRGFKETPLYYKGYDPSYIDKVMITSNSDCFLIKENFRQPRRPEIGDKFSSRHGQKGVVGLIVDQEDMPFNEVGICPDLIMNPHGFPSRMTVGKLIELLAGKAGVLEGKFQDGSAFGGATVTDISNELQKHNYNYLGKDVLYCGIDGRPMEAYIYSGPVFYQRLKHMVADKIHARSRGPRVLLTRQPTEGRSKDGGLRMGEMERDCLIAYGASMLIIERLMLSSDVVEMDVCKLCGLFSYSGWCHMCQKSNSVCRIKMPYACKLLFQELQAMSIVPKISLKKYCD
ncbi:DNA-directed RNA polymerase III subunit RPC2 [Myzus persicae]|uniref:DNA-directed RNA polymerase III subunit RPC2 n=1 Tax=Myzus persicae TaxID=13164 RepID=UPI000B9300ED|nr:DNA-directed RNA polymerase III subunit RPC2 [Myzus persicae]